MDKLGPRVRPLRTAAGPHREGLPVYWPCAGMIMLADRIAEPRPGQQTLGGLDITVRRNAFGRQVDSFEEDIHFAGLAGPPIRAVFIRAPWVEEVGEVCARSCHARGAGTQTDGPAAGKIVAVRQAPCSPPPSTRRSPVTRGSTSLFVEMCRTGNERPPGRATTKHQKAAKDAKRSKVFAAWIKNIEVAARTGGGDVAGNPTLYDAVQKAKKTSVPNDNIDRAIKRGRGPRPARPTGRPYEGYAPGGVAAHRVPHRQPHRAAAEVRTALTRNGGHRPTPQCRLRVRPSRSRHRAEVQRPHRGRPARGRPRRGRRGGQRQRRQPRSSRTPPTSSRSAPRSRPRASTTSPPRPPGCRTCRSCSTSTAPAR